ncbi:AAA family ATPase [Finegoldia magna]|uniref:AAA family ATPase n=1 Tax=Finegoldia magna TaxID=1260 RepID=UPI003999B2AE
MANYPKSLDIKQPLDLKLGIKSSIPKIKAPLALIYFLWKSNDKPSELLYSSEKNDEGNIYLVLDETVNENLYRFLEDKDLLNVSNRDKLADEILKNPILNSQIEALKVTFELVWKIVKFTFTNPNLSFSAERSKVNGKAVRYEKKMEFSNVLDLVDLVVEENSSKHFSTLFNWLINDNIDEKDSLVKLFTILSDEAIFRLRVDEDKDIKFNMSGIYDELDNNSEVIVNDYKENMGSLRILGSILREEFNYFLTKKSKSSSTVVLDNVSDEGIKSYANRVSTHFELLNIDLSLVDDRFKKTDKVIDDTSYKYIDKSHQRIFFGAPGTGKSYNLNREAQKYFGNNYERVTFHPNYMYGNFVGAFKPFPVILKNKDGSIKKDEDGNIKETITYEYIPGLLIRQLIKAYKNEDINYLLIVEEINRANVAAVFGDIFQLLDRDSNGESEYEITTSKELQEFLKKELEGVDLSENIKNKLGDDFSKIFLPSNFYIWATMNSADQGVMPMDTAFRRRWEFTYLGINDASDANKEEFANYRFKINSDETVNWDQFRRKLNEKLSLINIPEDKLIGPYFISKSILEGDDLDRLTETIKNKVLMYLYEDAAKAYRPDLFSEGKFSTYSSVCKNFDENALSLFKGNLDVETEKINKDNNIQDDLKE